MKRYRVILKENTTISMSYDIDASGDYDKESIIKIAKERYLAEVAPTLSVVENRSIETFGIEEIEIDDNKAPWMQFHTHNETEIQTMGTSLQGVVRVAYQDLIKIFGEDTCFDNYKTDAEWEIVFGDKQVATIYNYKDGRNYLGEDGMDKEDIIDWHVGGKSKEVYYRIEEIITDKGVWDETQAE